VESPVAVGPVTVFRDDQDPDQFWYLPGQVRLAPQPTGDDALSVLEYRFDPSTVPAGAPIGGAFVSLETELFEPKAGGLAAAVAGATGRDHARVTPVAFRSGSVRLIAGPPGDPVAAPPPTDAGAAAPDTVDGDADSDPGKLGQAPAPLVSPYHAAFGLTVPPEQATLLAQAAQGGTLPIGVVYEMRFLALTPALHAHVTMNYDQIYEHFAASIGFTYYVSVRLDLELSWLIEHDLVHIEITQYTDAADQARQQQLVLQLVQARIQGDFFHSGLPQPGGNTSLGSMLGEQITSSTAYVTVKARYDFAQERKDFDLRYDGQTAVELTHVASGFLHAMAADATTAPVVRQLDLTDPFFRRLDVAVYLAVDFDQLPDLREVVVGLAHRETRGAFVATRESSGPYRFQADLTEAGDDEYEYTITYQFAPESDAGPAQVALAARRTHDRALVVGVTGMRIVRVPVLLAPLAAGLVTAAPVQLRALDGSTEQARGTVTVDAAHPQAQWYRRLPDAPAPPRIVAQVGWVGADGQTHEGDEAPVDGAVIASGPIRDQIEVTVVPAADWAAVRQVLVDLRRTDRDLVQERRVTFTPQATTAPPVVLGLSDAAQRSYEWRQVVLFADGTSDQSPWATTDALTLLVGPHPTAAAAVTVTVTWLGDKGSALGVRVDFYQTPAGGAEQSVDSVLLQPASPQAVAHVPVDGGGLHYRYEMTRIDATGQTVIRSGVESNRVLVVTT
jgi:hypothetical protein